MALFSFRLAFSRPAGAACTGLFSFSAFPFPFREERLRCWPRRRSSSYVYTRGAVSTAANDGRQKDAAGAAGVSDNQAPAEKYVTRENQFQRWLPISYRLPVNAIISASKDPPFFPPRTVAGPSIFLSFIFFSLRGDASREPETHDHRIKFDFMFDCCPDRFLLAETGNLQSAGC